MKTLIYYDVKTVFNFRPKISKPMISRRYEGYNEK